MLPEKSFKKQHYAFLFENAKEGLIIPSKIKYNIQSGNLADYGYSYTGAMAVLRNILDSEYLWNTVRVQGGAYGCYSRFLRNGSVYFYSYRDPSIQKTYQAYQNAPLFLKEFCNTNADLTKYILGTINTIDRPLTNKEKADLAVARYLNHVTPEMQQTERDEVLTTTKKIKEYVPLLEKIVKSQNICTIGSEDAIVLKKDFFTQISPYMPSL